MLSPISNEQQEILDKLQNYNVIVDAVAGSGKTTTNLYIAKKYIDKNILLLTYNSKLKLETREKVKLLELNNIEVHSYHSFCVKYYDHKCFTDSEISKVLKKDKKPLRIFCYDIIILDEAQDITPVYYELICKICNNMKGDVEPKICLLGDKHQSIYQFHKSDEKYLTLGDKLFNVNNYKWKTCNLGMSFRVPNKICDFINHCVLNEPRILPFRECHIKPTYVICSEFPYEDKLTKKTMPTKYVPYGILIDCLKNYKPEDIFILAYSIKSPYCPARRLENYIKVYNADIPVYVPYSDDEKLDETIIAGKLTFSTFHQVKGLERKVVIIFGFDKGYFKFPGKSDLCNDCPNEFYVALTRAKEHLILLHHFTNDYLPFVNRNTLTTYANYMCKRKLFLMDSNNTPLKTLAVTNLIKYIPQSIIDTCYNLLTIIERRPVGTKIDLAQKIKNGEYYEAVNCINGIAVPAYFEFLTTNKCTILKESLNFNIEDTYHNRETITFHENQLSKLENIDKDKTLLLDNILYIATIYDGLTSGYIFKSYQITDYNWIEKEILMECIDRLHTLNIGKDCEYEKKALILKLPCLKKYNKQLFGRFDCIDSNTLYEFKCCEKIEKEHVIQLALYMLMHKTITEDKNVNKDFKYIIYNIITDQLLEIICDRTKLENMLEIILDSKFGIKQELLEQEFIDKNRIIYNKYYDII